MAYRVTAPLVCARDQAGRTHHRYYGEIVEWLPADQAKHLLDLGMVAKVGGAADPEPEVDDEPDDGEPQPRADGEMPLRAAPKADWVKYAVAKGADPVEAEALNKTELIELYG